MAYKTSTFLISLFCRFKITDFEIRKEITKLYTPLIDICRNDMEGVTQAAVLRFLVPSFKLTIDCLAALKATSVDGKISDTIRESFQEHINFQLFLIKKAGLRYSPSGVFNSIMNQVNITDIGCEIGDCIRLLKEDPDEIERQEILARLEVLLADYNSVTNAGLTIKQVLSNPEPINAEL